MVDHQIEMEQNAMRLRRLQDQRSTLLQQVEDLRENLSKARQENNKLCEQVEQFQVKFAEQNRRERRLEEEMAAIEASIEQEIASLDDVRGQTAEQRAAIRDTGSKLESLDFRTWRTVESIEDHHALFDTMLSQLNDRQETPENSSTALRILFRVLNYILSLVFVIVVFASFGFRLAFSTSRATAILWGTVGLLVMLYLALDDDDDQILDTDDLMRALGLDKA